MAGQLDLDLNYWTKFFSFDVKKLTKEDDDIRDFVIDAYKPLLASIQELVVNTINISPLSVYSFFAASKNYLDSKSKSRDDTSD